MDLIKLLRHRPPDEDDEPETPHLPGTKDPEPDFPEPDDNTRDLVRPVKT